ncbi:MAG: hypothetical protein VYC46_01380 [Pseudomonadota bacterium]|nr:hypothetical protein [Pseudomonadota bacterium]|tara:strand:+ start:4250 stop:4642 length:393 start_codon:yes stop_codon:yes gene_type:complete
MKHLIGLLVLFFSLSTQAEQETIYEIGDELEARKHSSLVLFHYKKDVNKVILLKKQIISYEDNFNFATVDSRDLYKIKRGEKIILTESLKEGEIFKVKLMEEKPKRKYYFVETESLKHYVLLEGNNPSSS